MRLPKIMEARIREMADVPAAVESEDIEITWADETYDSWGCDTCGYGSPDAELQVVVSWPRGKWSKTYTGYTRLSDFFAELDK